MSTATAAYIALNEWIKTPEVRTLSKVLGSADGLPAARWAAAQLALTTVRSFPLFSLLMNDRFETAAAYALGRIAIDQLRMQRIGTMNNPAFGQPNTTGQLLAVAEICLCRPAERVNLPLAAVALADAYGMRHGGCGEQEIVLRESWFDRMDALAAEMFPPFTDPQYALPAAVTEHPDFPTMAAGVFKDLRLAPRMGDWLADRGEETAARHLHTQPGRTLPPWWLVEAANKHDVSRTFPA